MKSKKEIFKEKEEYLNKRIEAAFYEGGIHISDLILSEFISVFEPLGNEETLTSKEIFTVIHQHLDSFTKTSSMAEKEIEAMEKKNAQRLMLESMSINATIH